MVLVKIKKLEIVKKKQKNEKTIKRKYLNKFMDSLYYFLIFGLGLGLICCLYAIFGDYLFCNRTREITEL